MTFDEWLKSSKHPSLLTENHKLQLWKDGVLALNKMSIRTQVYLCNCYAMIYR